LSAAVRTISHGQFGAADSRANEVSVLDNFTRLENVERPRPPVATQS
jgi:hypothetical protein